MTIDQLKKKIADAFSSTLGITKSKASTLLPTALTSGKAYEAYVLSIVCEQLTNAEGCSLRLVNGTNIVLKTSHGPINRSYPWIEVTRNGVVIGEIFTDVEFLAMSYSLQSLVLAPTLGHYHELDILMVETGADGRPQHTQILLGVECKNTGYSKSLLKEILGIRRELSYLAPSKNTIFNSWPRSDVPADPGSCLLVYSTSHKVKNYSAPGDVFGIDFIHQPM